MFRDIIICECGDLSHLFAFSYFVDKDGKIDEDEIFLSIHLNSCSLWERIINSIKHIFGHKSRYGDFHEIMIKKEKLQEILNSINEKFPESKLD